MKCSVFLLIAIASLLRAQSGDITIHMILHAVGDEHYQIDSAPDGIILNTTFRYADRGNNRTTSAELRMKPDYTPLRLDIKGRPEIVDLHGNPVLPPRYFTILGPSPFAIQMAMMRYWSAHGRPALLPVMRGNPRPIQFASSLPATIPSP